MDDSVKQVKSTCIIHYESTKVALSEELIKPASFESWTTLLEAAKLRNHTPVLRIAELSANDESVPDVSYHRQCRSRFTMKRELDTLRAQRDDSPEGCLQEFRRQSKRQKTSQSTVYDKVCIFCQKTRYIKGSHTREPLILAVDPRSDKTLREIATARQDTHILAITSREIVAAEAHYHRQCYRNYTRDPSRVHHDRSITEDMHTTEDLDYYKTESDSYEKLFQFIRTEVLDTLDVITLSSITNKLTQLMQSQGVSCIKDSTKKHIRRKIEQEFGSSIHIFPDDNGKLLLIPDSVTRTDIAKMYCAAKKELAVWKVKSSADNSTLDKAAAIIRESVKTMEYPSKWPYHPVDSTQDSISIPPELKRFFKDLLAGTNNKVSPKVDMLTQSFSQDLIYAITGGRYKPPKHVLLSYGVKSLTGNVELIQVLNRFGHAISYTQLEENETALCLQKLAATSNQSVILPQHIQPYLFTNLAFDNIDRLEETLTGGGTSHRVNGIAVQPRVFGPHLPKKPLPVIPKTKQRSVTFEDKPLPGYISGERVGPGNLGIIMAPSDLHSKVTQEAQKKNLIWMLTRLLNTSNQTVPSWTGFNIKTRDMIAVSQDVVGYLPTINAPATEMSTVLETLNNSELIRQELKLQQIVVVMDQALYAKATEILWQHKDKYKNIIIRMGTFHTIMTALAIIGKRFQDAGLRDICIESCLVVQGSVSAVVDGKAYNRAVRVHKCIFEGLLRTAWKGFPTWVETNHPSHAKNLTALLENVNHLHDDISQANLEIMLGSDYMTETSLLWDEYLQFLRHDNGELSAFWMSYIDIVGDILLGLIRASREGNWDLHLSAVWKLIPWCFAYDRVNYSRYLPVYFAQMKNLQSSHPEVNDHFQAGGFTVQLGGNNPFGRLPVDQTIEMTINKDTQTVGGTTKFSQKPSAVKRFYLTSEHRSAFLRHLRDMTNTKRNGFHHPDLQRPRIEKDEQNVTAVCDVLENWINPFEEHDLVCISTATAATQDVKNDLIKAHSIGEGAFTKFMMERFESDPPKKFHDPLEKQNLKTFSHMTRRKKAQVHGKTIVLKTDRSLFGRIVVIAQGRNLDMREVFCHPLGPLPWSLSTPEGTPRKTAKAVLARKLQKVATLANELPNSGNSATIIDGMSLVQRVKADVTTFGDIATAIHNMACKEAMNSSRIDIVFDTYKEISIKTVERANRGEEQGLQLHSITATQIVRQWRAFLKQGNNKSSLIEFLVQEWQNEKYTNKLQGKDLYVTHLEKCWRISEHRSEEVCELTSSHEEADGRLLLHAAHAASAGHSAVVICSEDTDVFVLCLAFSDQLRVPLFQRCGTQTRTRLINIGTICSVIGSDTCKALIGLHTFTGCDTVSAFAGKGKLRMLDIMKKNNSVRETFAHLGENWDVSPELQAKLEEVVCLLYARKPGTTDVNQLRYNLFCSHKGEIESHQLPPCKDSLMKHSQRANFQAAIWKKSLQADPDTPSPIGNGWKLEDGNLAVDWMDGSPAPQAVLELLSCKCTRTCRLPRCECLVNGLKCTDMCSLRDCENQPSTEDSEVTSTAEDVDYDDEDDEDENDM